MPDLSTLSAKKLREVIARRNARWGEMLDATLRAGLGSATHAQMVELARGSALLPKTQIARDYLNARHDWKVAMDELDARRDYHGSDKPIRRSA